MKLKEKNPVVSLSKNGIIPIRAGISLLALSKIDTKEEKKSYLLF
jgi:hypothetical protein